jgi:hypothetical protein
MRPTPQDLQFLQPEISESDIEKLKSGPRDVYENLLEEITFLATGPVFMRIDDSVKVISLCMFYFELDEMETRSDNYSLKYDIYPNRLPSSIFLNKKTKFAMKENQLTIQTADNKYEFMPITDALWAEATGIKEPWKTSFTKYMNGNTDGED